MIYLNDNGKVLVTDDNLIRAGCCGELFTWYFNTFSTDSDKLTITDKCTDTEVLNTGFINTGGQTDSGDIILDTYKTYEVTIEKSVAQSGFEFELIGEYSGTIISEEHDGDTSQLIFTWEILGET